MPHVIQSRTAEQMVEEVEYLKSTYGIEGLNLRDEIAIPLNPQRAVAHLAALKQGGLIWRGQTKVGSSSTNAVPREIIALAADSGCVELAIGVESASQRVMDIVDKRQDISQVRRFIADCHDYGIKIKMCLILGLPGEQADIAERTCAFIDEAGPDFVNVSGFCPMPGSAIFGDPEKYGIKHIDRDWRRYAHLMYRFSDDETFGLPFEYADITPWGRGFSRREISENIRKVQHFLQKRGMAY
jgi:radical SAM superfamily enzyme YgiQ (UPF0313 family)